MAAKPEPLRVVIPGTPVAWARAGRSGRHSFTPSRQKAWETKARAYMLQARGSRPPYSGALAVAIIGLWPDNGGDSVWKTTRPDVDNAIVKNVLDAGNGILWKDDSLVVRLTAEKRFAKLGNEARVEVIVEALQ